jgi:hypothetical protein
MVGLTVLIVLALAFGIGAVVKGIFWLGVIAAFALLIGVLVMIATFQNGSSGHTHPHT